MQVYENFFASMASSFGNSFSLATFLMAGSASILAFCYSVFGIRNVGKDEPPIVKGLPVIGSGKAFQENAVELLQDCAKTYGNMFTLRMPIQTYLHILMDPHSLDLFCRQKSFDFDVIQKQVNWNVFNFKVEDSAKMIRDIAMGANTKNIVDDMHNFALKLEESYDTRSVESNWSEDHLLNFVTNTSFRAIFNSLFGRSDEHAFNHAVVKTNFVKFHEYFTYMWLGFPVQLMPEANTALKNMLAVHPSSEEMLARPDISNYIRAAVNHLKDLGQSESDIIGHNLVYLHVNYNTSKISFWILANLLKHPEALAAVRKELVEEVQKRREVNGANCPAVFTQKDLEKDLPQLDSIIKETFRVSSGVFMVRGVSEDTQFTLKDGTSYLLRKDDKVAFYPPALHLDPEVFEEPKVFKYDRFVDAKFYKNGQQVVKPVLPYGTICPGQKLSLTQIKWFLLSCVNQFEMELTADAPEFDTSCYGHEILPPVQDVPIRMRPRTDVLNIQYL